MKKKEEPIRIAQIVGKWLGGGVEAVVMNYYRHLDHDKIQFDFICDDDSTNIPYDEIEKLGGRFGVKMRNNFYTDFICGIQCASSTSIG